MKVSYLGLNSLFGRVTTNLLKQSPCIHKLTLYDDGAPPHAIEHPNVIFGRDNLQDAIKDVNIVVIGDEAGGGHEEDRLRAIGPKVIRYTEAIVKFSPNAIVIVAASPLNILFPLIGNVLGPDWQDRLLGTTSVDTMRASRALDGLLNDPQGQAHILPVIGGASISTRVPLFSHICPQITVSDDIREQITQKMKLLDSAESEDMDAMERAYTTVRFIHSVLAGLTRDTSVPEIAMTKTNKIPETTHFSLPILIGRKGIERAADLPKMDDTEEKLFLEAAQKLSEESKKSTVLGKQFSEEIEADDLKKETLLKIRDTNFHEVTGQKLTSKLQKTIHKDPFPRSFRGRGRKDQQFGKKTFLELPCVDPVSSAKSPIIIKTDNKEKTLSNVSGTANANDEPESDYSEILTNEVHAHLSSLKLSHESPGHKSDLFDESTEGDFSETLKLEVEDHLNSLTQGQKTCIQCENTNEASGKNGLESRGALNQSVLSNKDQNRFGDSHLPEATVSSTPFKRMNNIIADAKPFKTKSALDKSDKMAKCIPAQTLSPSVRTNNAIKDQPENKEGKQKLRPTTKSDIPHASQEFEGDAKRELRPRNDSTDYSRKTSRAAVKEKSKPKVDLRDIGAPTLDTESLLLADAKRELRPRDHTPGTLIDGAKKELRPRDEAAEKRNENTAATDTKGKQRPRVESSNTAAFEANQKDRKHTAQRTQDEESESKARARVNLQVLEALDEDKSSGDHMSKSQMMMLKRKKQQAEKDKQAGEDGDAVKRVSKVQEGIGTRESRSSTNEKYAKEGISGGLTVPGDNAVKVSTAKTMKNRVVGRVGRRVAPTRKSSEKRRHRGNKMVYSGGKWKPPTKEAESGKDSESSTIPPTVTAKTSKRIDTVRSDVKMRSPGKHRDRRDRSQHSSPRTGSLQAVPNAPNSSDTVDTKISTIQRSQSPKPVHFKPNHHKQDISSHLLTDVARRSKLNSLHHIQNEELNTEKTSENAKFEPDFKIDASKNTPKTKITKQANKALSRPKSRESDSPSARIMDEHDVGGTVDRLADKELTSDKTMNYFMRQRKEGPIQHEACVVAVVEPHRHIQKNDEKTNQAERKSEPNPDKLKKRRSLADDQKTKEVSRNDQRTEVRKNPDQLGNVKDREYMTDTEDAWESKYFTKASEMFFKMFRDTVTCTAPKIESASSTKAFLGEPRKTIADMKTEKEPVTREQLPAGTAIVQNVASNAQGRRNAAETQIPGEPKYGTISRIEDKSKSGKTHQKINAAKIRIRVDKSVNAKCQMHPEASTKTSNMCENVIFHKSTRNSLQDFKSAPKEQKEENNPKQESPVSLDKLFEESSTVPIIVGAKNDKSWRSVESSRREREKPAGFEGAAATSDKGRGDALHKVDFTVSRAQETSKTDVWRVEETSKMARIQSKSERSPNRAMKIPIASKTIKQVNVPYQTEMVKNGRKQDETPMPEKSYKWGRIVNAFRNIIISDIEGKSPRIHHENSHTPPAIVMDNIAKTVDVKKPANLALPEAKRRGVFKVKSKSENVKKKKHESAKKKHPSDPRKVRTMKNNPKKIVNYFSRRGASSASYDRQRFDGQSYLHSEGLASQTSVSMGQNGTSFARPSKIK